MKQLFQYKKLIGLLLLAVTTLACKNEFLEIDPKGVLIASKTIDYDNLLYGINPVSISATVPMGDEMAAVQPYFPTSVPFQARLFGWEDDIYDIGQTAAEFKEHLTMIYVYNKVINEVMASTEGTEQRKKSLLAEALACRAWTYFYLINLYGKPYSENSASKDPGFPILKEANVTETRFVRATVKEVYDFILSDLTRAIPDLPATTIYRTRICRPAAEGLLGKVYVFMGRYQDALVSLKAALTSTNSSTIPVGLYNYNETFAQNGSFLPVDRNNGPTQPIDVNNKEIFFSRTSTNLWSTGSNELVINTQTADLFGSSDLRRKFYSVSPRASTTIYPSRMLRRMGPNIKYGVVVPDLYLLSAESKARLNDLSGAEADIETLRKARMPISDAEVPGTIVSDRKAFVRFILEERIREFAVLGYRWFDMRRLSVDTEFSSVIVNTHQLYSASGAVVSTFTLRPERFVLRLPLLVMDQNPGMQNNP